VCLFQMLTAIGPVFFTIIGWSRGALWLFALQVLPV
jgi:hypothetical protein